MKKIPLVVILFFIGVLVHLSYPAATQTNNVFFKDASKPIELRLQRLLDQLTAEEKIAMLGYKSPAIPRLGINAYNWWNEALHGVARAGMATVFPQAIGMAATFNDSLTEVVASAIATEARAKHNLALKRGSHEQYMGLTFWSPNINIFRDPRWGRGQETYGEDPFLTAMMGAAYVRGMQGKDSRYLKTAAAAKHFAVHSGPEKSRHIFNAVVDEKDLRETYLYAFKKLVDQKVEAVMCAYNRLNGSACCVNDLLLNNILKKEWGFTGHIVTDCWALDDVYKGHQQLENPVLVAAAAIKAGVSIDCSGLLQQYTKQAIQENVLPESTLNDAIKPSLRTLFKLGFFDTAANNPYLSLNEKDINSSAHRTLALDAARQSMVLLKNDKNILPLRSSSYKSIMIIGPNAGAIGPLLGNYHGLSPQMVSFAEGITLAAGPSCAVQYDQGCDNMDTTRFSGVWSAGLCDLTIAVLGLNPTLEGEEHDAFLSEGGGDKNNLDLPAAQIKLLQQLKKNGKPLVVILTAGSCLNIAAIEPYADAILLAWYPGEQGGNAAADILFGKYSPAGSLPVTFYKSLNDLPPYDNYAMNGRTYRYYDGAVQYPFGYGLSYTKFKRHFTAAPIVSKEQNKQISFSVLVSNTGAMDGDEVLQVYVQYPKLPRMPFKELKAFKRIALAKGESRSVDFTIPVMDLQKWDVLKAEWKLYPGEYKIFVGRHANDTTLHASIIIK